MDALRDGVDSPTPGSLLGSIGVVLGVAAGADDPAGTMDDLVRSLSGVDRVETSAALLAIATLTADPDLRRRVRREIAERGHVLPRWLAELDRSTPVDRAVEISTVFRDADELLVGVTVPGGHPLTAVVRIDNDLGAVATDGYVVQSPLASVVPLLVEDDEPDVRVRDIAPADARARITAALQELDLGPGRLGSETWAQSRPLVEWMLSLLPGGGRGDVLQDLSEDELDEIADRFLAGGAPWSDVELRPLLDEVLAAGSANGIGDPLLWSRRNVRRVLGPDLLFLSSGTPHLDRAPDLLRDLIRFGHAERGLRQELTDDALAAVDASAGAFLAAVRGLDEDDAD
ncbi:hypothetical protein [Geodermatophilus maliterrae]|uniref:HEAT repeat-containing protein n=1 Tax=Geodermatophilus maliterrae TaxID=3162531 RepID=A0ABV3XFK5_9ACTN